VQERVRARNQEEERVSVGRESRWQRSLS
jgi:hypothetical protein